MYAQPTSTCGKVPKHVVHVDTPHGGDPFVQDDSKEGPLRQRRLRWAPHLRPLEGPLEPPTQPPGNGRRSAADPRGRPTNPPETAHGGTQVHRHTCGGAPPPPREMHRATPEPQVPGRDEDRRQGRNAGRPRAVSSADGRQKKGGARGKRPHSPQPTARGGNAPTRGLLFTPSHGRARARAGPHVRDRLRAQSSSGWPGGPDREGARGQPASVAVQGRPWPRSS